MVLLSISDDIHNSCFNKTTIFETCILINEYQLFIWNKICIFETMANHQQKKIFRYLRWMARTHGKCILWVNKFFFLLVYFHYWIFNYCDLLNFRIDRPIFETFYHKSPFHDSRHAKNESDILDQRRHSDDSSNANENVIGEENSKITWMNEKNYTYILFIYIQYIPLSIVFCILLLQWSHDEFQVNATTTAAYQSIFGISTIQATWKCLN